MNRPPVGQHQLAFRIFILGIAISLAFLTGCSKSQQALVEAPPAYQPSPPAPLPDVPKLPAKENEVQVAVKRVFKDAAVLDTSHEPNFIAGDFNGDNSQDIAVVIKPAAGKLAAMNEEYPAWIVKDPFAPLLTRTSPRIEANDVLLAIIHGHEANDWRDPQATQTYLLKNAVGSHLTVQKKKDALIANPGKKVPRLQGDVIEETLRGNAGYLYFTGPTYAWYDPNTFKGEPELRLVHPGIKPKAAN